MSDKDNVENTKANLNQIIPIFKTALQEGKGEEVNAVDARLLWEFLESKRNFGNWISERIEQYSLVQGVDFTSFNKIVKRETGSTTLKEYYVKIDIAKELSMVERNEKGKQARKYFLECERQAKTLQEVIPRSLPEALRLYAQEIELKELALKERDHAIKTKAQINNTKTATAMATASAKSKETERVKVEIGNAKKWKQAKAIPWLKEYFNLRNRAVYGQIGKYLTKLSREYGYPLRKMEDSTWGAVNVYPIEAIDKFKELLPQDYTILEKFRWPPSDATH
jgi:anti-repressor protein